MFEIRATAAVRLWRVFYNSNPGDNPALLTAEQRKRFMLELRALDGMLDGRTYREICDVLKNTQVLAREWKSHDLRGYTIRLAKDGFKRMSGNYRKLLLHPYRRPPRRAPARP